MQNSRCVSCDVFLIVLLPCAHTKPRERLFVDVELEKCSVFYLLFVLTSRKFVSDFVCYY